MVSEYIFLVKDYFFSKKLIFLSFASVFFIYIFHFCLSIIFDSDQFYFIYWQFMQPFFVYISMIFIFYFYSKNILLKKKYKELGYKEVIIIVILFLMKCVWNILEVLFLETDFIQTSENSKLYLLFLLGFLWITVYLISAYFFPKQFLGENNKISFFSYIKKYFFELCMYLIFSIIFVFFIIFCITFIASKLSLISFLSCSVIHSFIEDILGIYCFILLAHLVCIYFLRLYDKKVIKSL